MRVFRRAVAVGMAALVACAAAAPASAQPSEYYAGKTLTILVGLAAGGSADTLARAIAPYLHKYIPGQPGITVQNMTGAGGVVAFNYLYNVAKPDGLTIIITQLDPLAQTLGNQGLKQRYDQFELLGGIGDIRVDYMRVDAVPGGMKRSADVANARNVAVGAYATTDVAGILAHLSLEVLGVPHKVVSGYRGGADVFLALQRGEVTIHNTSLATFRTRSKAFVASGQGMGIAYLVPSDSTGSYQRDPRVGDMPAFQDLYKEIHGKLPEGPAWEAFNWAIQQFSELAFVAMARPGLPEPALAALRKAFAETMKDSEFIADSTRRNGLPFDYVDVEKGQKALKALSGVSPQVLNALRASLAAMGG